MKKSEKKTIRLAMEVDVKGEDRYISQVRINGKRISEEAIIALAATLQRYHLR